MTLNKLGLHIDCNREYSGQFEAIGANPPPVVVAIVNPNDPSKAAPYLNKVPYLVLRLTGGEDALRGSDGLNAESNALNAYYRYAPYLKFYPNAYWAYFRNEVGDWNKWEHYCDEMVAWAKILAANGYKAALGNFSVGTPDLFYWDSVGMVKLLAACEKYGSVLNIHEYGLDGTMSEPYTALRHQQGVIQGMLNLYNVKVVIGETGLDRPGGTWQERGLTPDQYLAMLRGYNAELVKDSKIVGAAVFQWSAAAEWQLFNIAGPVVGGIFADIKASTPAQLPSTPDLQPPHPLAGNYEVLTTVNIRDTPNTLEPSVGRFNAGAIVRLSSIIERPNGDVWGSLGGQGYFVAVRYNGTQILKSVI